MKELKEPVKKHQGPIRVSRPGEVVDDVCQYQASHGPVTAEHVRTSPRVREWIAGGRLVSISPTGEDGTTPVTRLTKAKTQEQMKSILEKAKGRIYAEKHAEGYEVLDLRPLVERLENPIRGRGVKYWFGSTHMIVTEKLLSKFDVIHA